MPEAIDILDGLETVFENDVTLAGYVGKIYRSENEIDLLTKGVFPFINITVTDMKVGKADNQREYDYNRHTYSFIITFAVRTKSLVNAVEGNETDGIIGIWEMAEDIRNAIKTDRTLDGSVDDVPPKIDTACDCVSMPDGNFFIGRGVIMFTAFKDVFVR